MKDKSRSNTVSLSVIGDTALIGLIIIASLLASCNFRNPQPKYPVGKVGYVYGKPFDYSIFISATQLPEAMKNRTRVDTTINGKVIAVSNRKDGWLKLDAGKGRTILVEWNHLFDVGKDIVGKNATLNGCAYLDTMSVADLKKQAAEGNMPEADIDTISHPQIQLAYKTFGIIAY